MAGIQNACATEFDGIGSLACETFNPFMDTVSLILTSDDFEFATKVLFATESEWNDGIKAGKVLPLHEIIENDDQSEDAIYYDAPNGLRIPRKLGNYKNLYRFNKSLKVHKALQGMRNAKFRLFLVDSAGTIFGWSPDGTKVKGFSLSLFNPEKMTWAKQDNTPAWTPIAIDMKDSNQWNSNGVHCTPAWYASELKAVTDVTLEVVSKTASLIVLRVYYDNGIAPDGTVDKIGVPGVLQGDFVFTTTAPTGGAMVDNGDGTYNFPGVAMASGSVKLIAPDLATSGGNPIRDTATHAITI